MADAYWEKAKIVPKNRKTPTPTSRRIKYRDEYYWVPNGDIIKIRGVLQKHHLRERDGEDVYAYENVGITIPKRGERGVVINVRGISEDDIKKDVSSLEQMTGIKLLHLEASE